MIFTFEEFQKDPQSVLEAVKKDYEEKVKNMKQKQEMNTKEKGMQRILVDLEEFGKDIQNLFKDKSCDSNCNSCKHHQDSKSAEFSDMDGKLIHLYEEDSDALLKSLIKLTASGYVGEKISDDILENSLKFITLKGIPIVNPQIIDYCVEEIKKKRERILQAETESKTKQLKDFVEKHNLSADDLLNLAGNIFK